MSLRTLWHCWGVALVTVSGCGSTPAQPVDGGPPRLLDVLVPPGTQIGLRYAEEIDLRVKYHLDSPGQPPLGGSVVQFAIFGDPGGSTLAMDRAKTGDDGIASVQLTGGAQERSFLVRASAAGAPDAEFGVTVSKMAFVGINVVLDYQGPATIGTLRALLYTDHVCADLQPSVAPVPAFRMVSQTGAPKATLAFLNLLSQTYSVVGRAEDAAGHLVAAGCVDLAAAVLPSGATATLPLPLTDVKASALGNFQLTSSFTLQPALATAAAAPWHKLSACATSPAQDYLDATELGLAAPLVTAIEAKRGAADATTKCRPATLPSTMPTLDAQLESLLTTGPSPGSQLAAIATDLDSILKVAEIDSRLTIGMSGAATLSAQHALQKVTLSAGPPLAKTATYDLADTTLPLIVAKDVPIDMGGVTLALGQHGFTLGLGTFWNRALADLSLATRVPAVLPRTSRGLVEAVVAAAMRNGKTGCAAVEDLVCTTTGACTVVGAVTTACTAALDPLAAALDAPFAPPSAIDFSLVGQGTAFDADGDLLIDTIKPGSWTTPLAQSASFSGVRAP